MRKERLQPLTKYDLPKTHGVNGYATCTPVSDGEHVYALFSNGMGGCYDLDGERKAEDKGREARYLRAAKMYAVAKGLGFAGAHIGGHGLAYETLEYIVEKGEELSPQWRDFVGEFD
jgi:hypothetical protein